MVNIYLIILNWCGNIASCLYGIIAARKLGQKLPVQFLSGLLVTFGGGAFLRDIIILKKLPIVLECPYEIVIVCILVFIIWIVFNCNKKCDGRCNISPRVSILLKKGLVVLDSFGILAFAIIGHDWGLEIDGTYSVAILCGFITTCGGGILAGITRYLLIRGQPSKEKLKLLGSFLNSNKSYYAYGFMMTLTYSVITMLGGSKGAMILLLTPITLVIGFFTDTKIG